MLHTHHILDVNYDKDLEWLLAAKEHAHVIAKHLHNLDRLERVQAAPINVLAAASVEVDESAAATWLQYEQTKSASRSARADWMHAAKTTAYQLSLSMVQEKAAQAREELRAAAQAEAEAARLAAEQEVILVAAEEQAAREAAEQAAARLAAETKAAAEKKRERGKSIFGSFLNKTVSGVESLIGVDLDGFHGDRDSIC